MQVQHLQTQIDRTGYTGATDCLKKLYKSDGFLGLYKVS
jgi:hypothetical protein